MGGGLKFFSDTLKEGGLKSIFFPLLWEKGIPWSLPTEPLQTVHLHSRNGSQMPAVGAVQGQGERLWKSPWPLPSSACQTVQGAVIVLASAPWGAVCDSLDMCYAVNNVTVKCALFMVLSWMERFRHKKDKFQSSIYIQKNLLAWLSKLAISFKRFSRI